MYRLKNGIKRTHPNLAAFGKHPHLTARTITGQQSGFAKRRKVGAGDGQLRSESSDPWPQRGSRHRCLLWAAQVLVLERTNSSTKYHTLTPERLGGEGVPRGLQAASALSLDHPDPGQRGDAVSSPWPVREPGLASGGVQRGGTRRRAHSTPAANSPHKVGFVSAPCPLAPGKRQQSPQKGEGCGVESLGSAGSLRGASQRAESGHPAPRCVSRAITGRGSLSAARGSAGSPREASKGLV